MFITVNQNLIENQSKSQNTEPRRTWLRLQDGEQVFVQMMLDADNFVGYYRHTVQVNGKWEYIHCANPATCPCCQKKIARKLRTLVPMIVADDMNGTNTRVMIFDASVNDVKEFYIAKNECIEDGADFINTIFKFKRVGSKLDTTYRLTATRGNAETFKGGLEVKIPQWDKLIKFPTPSEVEAILTGNRQATPSSQSFDRKTDDFLNNNQDADPFTAAFGMSETAGDDIPF